MVFDKVKEGSKNGTDNILKTVFKYSNILGLIGILVTVLIFYFSEKKRELTLSIDSFISLVDKNSLSGSGIKVSFDSVKVDNLYKVNCSLINTGNSAITNKDLVESIVISFDPSAVLLKYEVNQIPLTIKVNDKIKNNTISIEPDLLNPDEKINFTIYYTVNKSSVLPTTNSRIIDGKILIANKFNEVNKRNKFIIPFSPKTESVLFWIALVWNGLFFILIVWALFFQKTNKNSFLANFFGFIIVGSGCVLTILYLLAGEIFMI